MVHTSVAPMFSTESKSPALGPVGPAMVVISDVNDRILWVCPEFTTITGYKLSDVQGRKSADVLHGPDTDAFVAGRLMACVGNGIAFEGEILNYDKRGRGFWVRLTVEPIRDEQGNISLFASRRTGLAEQATSWPSAKEQTVQTARQRNELVREVHHRIKNSLQGVAGLLRQHAIEQPGVAAPLERAIAQVRTVAVVHGLEGQAIYNEVVLCEMVPSIARMVEEIIQLDRPIRVDVDVPERIRVDEQERVPLALIINELIMNAAKHSLKQTGRSSVDVSVAWSSIDHAAHVCVRNSGWLPDDFDFAAGQGIGTGLELARSMLSPRGALLGFESRDGMVEARLILSPPAIYSLRNNTA